MFTNLNDERNGPFIPFKSSFSLSIAKKYYDTINKKHIIVIIKQSNVDDVLKPIPFSGY